MSKNTNDDTATTNASPEAELEHAASETEQAPTLDPIDALQVEVEKWKDLALRNAAEMDNYRKRSARDMQETRAYANADLLRALFPILDNFEMGLEAARSENDKSMIFMGMNMVFRQLADFLKEQGVEEVPAQGGVFDPNLHDAVSQEASDTVPEGSVVRVSRRGFKLKDRLLRAASVVVSTGKQES